jgi:transposase
MRDKDLYTQILGINPPWKVTDVELSVDSGEVKVFIEQRSRTAHQCSKCGVECPGYHRRQRFWRHLDTCQLKTIKAAPEINFTSSRVRPISDIRGNAELVFSP